jgi:7-keto-8-aminopelargonate synthetase-like enzyme
MSGSAWAEAARQGLAMLTVGTAGPNRWVVDGHEFVNMCSSAYLGLNSDPRVLHGAADALRQAGATGLTVSTTRMRHRLLADLEDRLGDLFGATVLTGQSCSALTAGVLPLIAAGELGDRTPRTVVFDAGCHPSLRYQLPLCAARGAVLDCPAGDLGFLETACRRGPCAYVTDGVHAAGGAAPLAELAVLQDRYGLMLYVDDSHGLSVLGARGQGLARSQLPPSPPTFIVATLHKGFGAGGGVLMFHRPALRDLLQREAGPVSWSQGMDLAMVGAARVSAEIHASPELAELQASVQRNLARLDALLPATPSGHPAPIRVVEAGSPARANAVAAGLMAAGFYTSTVVHPVTARGREGLRMMARSDLSPELIADFAGHARDLLAAGPA